MGKVLPFKPRPRPKKRVPSPAEGATGDEILGQIFVLAMQGKSEEECRTLLARVGENYGTFIRRHFGARDAKHYVRVFCGGVRNGGGT